MFSYDQGSPAVLGEFARSAASPFGGGRDRVGRCGGLENMNAGGGLGIAAPENPPPLRSYGEASGRTPGELQFGLRRDAAGIGWQVTACARQSDTLAGLGGICWGG
jgi:hypothetical protein